MYNNSITMFLFKSNRKNSKCSEPVNVYHLIKTEGNDKKISDDRIISQFIGTIEDIIHKSKYFNNNLELSAYVSIEKNSSYINANNDIYNTTEQMRYNWQRVQFSSIEQCVNFIYSLYCLIYPYNKLNLRNTIYNNLSIKHLINEYYRKEEVNV